MILDQGYWAGLTLYPQTKVSAARAADIVERFGLERICIAGACDWGPSDPIAVPRFIMEMRRRRHPDELIHRLVYENPVQFLSQSPRFNIRPGDPADQGRVGKVVVAR
jgi:predicted metal-dependent TIM-barrel fold hydrolase